MIKAMERKSRLPVLFAGLAGSFMIFVEIGCAGMGGFRSVGTERPSLLGLRTTSPGSSPSTANDSYAQNMAGGRKIDTTSDRTELASGGSGDKDGGSRATGERTAAKTTDKLSKQTTAVRETEGEKAVRVSLGRPEPLPRLGQPSTQIAKLTTETASPRWKPELTDRRGELAKSPQDSWAASGAPTAIDAGSPARNSIAMDSRAILDQSESRLNGMNTYQVKISRIERVGGHLQPEEDIVLSIQREPKAVRLEWTDGPNKGREVIYSSKLDPRMLFVHVPSSAIAIPTMKIAVDSPMVMRNSRHPITDAGFDTIIENLRKAQSTAPEGRSGSDSLEYRGLEKTAGIDSSAHHFVRTTLSGEIWDVYLDSETTLPRLVSAKDSKGELVERYVYRELRADPAELKLAGAFAPDQRWGESSGLLSRLARAATGPSQPSASQSATR